MSHTYLTLSVIPAERFDKSVSPNNLNSGLKLNIIPTRSENLTKRTRISKYTLDVLLQRGREIHGNKYDYSNIKSEHIKGRDSHVPVKCNSCNYEWNPSIHDHITHKSGCPICSRNARWTLDRLLIRLNEVHGDKFDYSQITKEHVKNSESRIPVTCKTCYHRWEPDIHSHVRGTKCPGCVKRVPWTLERVLIRFAEVHGDIYDYSEITREQIINCNSHIPIICKTCNRRWNPTIDSHVKGGGCPKCNKSKGEKICLDILEKMDLNPDSQVRISALPRQPFDFGFEYIGNKWLLEFDGQQHFHFNEFFHRDIKEFINRQLADIIKTKTAIKEGYKVIHIDYTQIDNVEYHIMLALKLEQSLYLSTPILYSHYN